MASFLQGRARIAVLAGVIALPIWGGALAGAAPAPVGLVYAGQTTQQEVIVLETNAARSRVVSVSWGWSASCVAGPAATPTTELTTAWTEYRGGYVINPRTNRWKRNFTVTNTDAGVSRTFAYQLQGTKVGVRMKGTLNVAMTDKGIDGQVIRTCDSGPVKFGILERHIYGGETSQQELLGATFNAARNQIRRLEWNWTATCTKGPAARPTTNDATYWRDLLTRIPFNAKNRFVSKFTFAPEIDATNSIARQFSYNVNLTRVGQQLRGSIAAQFVEYDAPGGVAGTTPDKIIRTCASGKVKLVGVKD